MVQVPPGGKNDPQFIIRLQKINGTYYESYYLGYIMNS